VWKKAINIVSYKSKLVRVQRLINIKIAKAYRTVLNEALCILTGLTPIDIKVEEAFQIYEHIRGSTKEELLVDRDMRIQHTNRKSFPDNIKRSSLHLDWVNTYRDKSGGSGQIEHHHEG
jgi:hypothetical protein